MKASQYIASWFFLSVALVCLGGTAFAEMGSGRGGPFFQFHMKPLSSFDPQIGGNIMAVGGKGVGSIAKNFRLGGGGGGGFAWGSGDNVTFGMGYGGVQAEYSISPWLTAGMLIGGGGFAISRILAETTTTTTFEKISAGGFVLFYPSVDIEFKVRGGLTVIGSLGYFLPSNTRLHSMTLGLSLQMGKF